jgi:translation initiation factor 2A
MASPLQFAYRTQKAIGVVDAAPVYEPLSGFVKPEGNLRCCAYSLCGRYFAWASNEGVSVIDASVGHVLTSLLIPNVYELGFSPRGTFLSTWERPAKDENGDATKNLKVWRTCEDLAEGAEKQPLGCFVQKAQSGWNLQYTTDEKFCARTVTNEVQFYDSNDLATVWNKLRVEGVADFALSPGQNHTVAVFIPERKVGQRSLYWRTAVQWCDADASGNRVNPLPSKSSASRTSRAPFLRRHFSKETRSSSSGISKAQA